MATATDKGMESGDTKGRDEQEFEVAGDTDDITAGFIPTITATISSIDDSVVVADGEVFNPLNGLTESQLAALEHIRAIADKYCADEEERKWCTDMCLLRYLRARDYNVSKSEKLLKGTLDWRREFKPDSVTIQEIELLARTGTIYVHGFDKKLRPIVLMRPYREASAKAVAPPDIKFKHLFYWLDTAIKRMDESKGVEKLCLIVDYKDYSRKHMDMKTNLRVMHYLLDHLPERLGVCFFLDPPLLFWVGWKVISPFLNEVTLSKVRFVQSKKRKDGTRDCPAFFELIDEEVLEAEYGGRQTKVYDYDAYVNNGCQM